MATRNLIGQVEPFQLGVEDWDQYTERLEQYFVCNGIEDDKNILANLERSNPWTICQKSLDLSQNPWTPPLQFK